MNTSTKSYYPRGENYETTTSKRVFFQIKYFKPHRKSDIFTVDAYYGSFKTLKIAFDRIKETGGEINDIIQWTLPEGFKNLYELASDIKFYESSKSIYEYGKLIKTKEAFSKKLRFTGDFKDLKDLGYKHSKFYANNYKAYTLINPEYDTENLIHIWVAEKDIQIDSVSERHNIAIYNHLISLSKEEREELLNSSEAKEFNFYYGKFKDDKFSFVSFDESMDLEDLKTPYRMLEKYNNMLPEKLTEEILNKKAKYEKRIEQVLKDTEYDIKDYMHIEFSNEALKPLIYLIDNNMISIVDKERY